MAILELRNLSKSFGGLKVVRELDMAIERGEIRGLIGPNGAGKTTLLNVITGFYRPDSGTVHFQDEDITKLAPYQIAAKGIVRTFQTAEPFSGMTVLQNVLVGRHIYGKSGVVSSALTLWGQRREEKSATEKAMEALRLVGLDHLKDQLAGSLAFGPLRLLEIARALATEPKMLLLDEPAAGMNTAEQETLHDLLQNIRERQMVTILLVEHNLSFLMRISDLITVLDYGEKIAEGAPETVRNDPRVIEAYIGTT